MENDKAAQMEKRMARKRELDDLLASGNLTLEAVREMRPTDTSLEHHQTLMRTLSGKAIESTVSL